VHTPNYLVQFQWAFKPKSYKLLLSVMLRRSDKCDLG
jgi:hypothetical protein